MDSNSPSQFNPYPLIILAAAFAAGVLFANFVDVNIAVASVAATIFCIVAAAFRGRAWTTVALVIAFVAVGAVSMEVEQRSFSENRLRNLYDAGYIESHTPVEIEGVLTAFPEAAYEGEFLTLSADRIISRGNERAVAGKMRIYAPKSPTMSETSKLIYGSRIRAACNLEREDEFRNPGVIPREEMLDRQGIDATCSVKSALLIEHIADESVFIPLAKIYEWRANLIDVFRLRLDQRTSGVMIASLLGNKNYLDRDTAQLFRDGGTFHILVISGLHITFIGGVMYFFVAQATRNRWLRFLIVNLVLAAYTLAVGADVPVVRAAVMFAILSLGAAIFRQRNLLNSLAASTIVLLAWRPSDLLNPSFQLTLVSVGAIVAIAFPMISKLREIGTWMPDAARPFPPNVGEKLRRVAETFYWNPMAWTIESGRQIWSAGIAKNPYLPSLGGTLWQRTGRYLFEGMTVSLVVQIAMLPLLIVYFHTVSISAVILNIWVGIFIAVTSFAAVLGAIAMQVSNVLAQILFRVADLSNAVMLALPNLIAGDGITRFRVPAYVGDGRVFYALYFLPLAVLIVLLNRWEPFALRRANRSLIYGALLPSLAGLAILAAVIVWHPLSRPEPNGRLHVDFIDVGQGDSALVTFPDGTTMLIDGGGRLRFRRDEEGESGTPFEPDVIGIGERVVSQVLWAKGYSEIDYLVATHSDADHIQGFTDVVSNFAIDQVLVEKRAWESVEFSELAEILRRKAIGVNPVSTGSRMSIGGASVEVLSPSPEAKNLVSDNDRSLVIRITYGERSFLFTGDIEAAAEKGLVVPEVDVVKVAHHGSRTSSTQEFIDAARSRFAIIPVGRRSRFGHPHPEVVERWTRSGARVLTTGESGMISLSTDGQDLQLSGFAK